MKVGGEHEGNADADSLAREAAAAEPTVSTNTDPAGGSGRDDSDSTVDPADKADSLAENARETAVEATVSTNATDPAGSSGGDDSDSTVGPADEGGCDSEPASAPALCEFADVETLELLSARLLNTMATRVVQGGLQPSDAMAEVRGLLSEKLCSAKKGPRGLAVLHARLEKLEARRSFGGRFVSNVADKVAGKARELEVRGEYRHGGRQRLALQLVQRYDTTREWHCGCDMEQLGSTEREVRRRESSRVRETRWSL